MSFLSFLKSATVEEVKKEVAARGGATGPRKQRNPNPAIVAIRVWKDGSVFPSQAARDKFDLEYRNAVVTKEALPKKEADEETKYKNVYEFPEGTGNGLDLIDSRAWGQYSGAAMLFVAVTPKNAGKVDLFASTVYEETGVPKSTVMDQGAATFGKDVLLPVLKEVYGIELNEENEFVDLEIVEELSEGGEVFNITTTFSKDILYAPKRITRGAQKGKSDYSIREGVKVYGLFPIAATPAGDNDPGTAGESEEEVPSPEVLTVGTGAVAEPSEA